MLKREALVYVTGLAEELENAEVCCPIVDVGVVSDT